MSATAQIINELCSNEMFDKLDVANSPTIVQTLLKVNQPNSLAAHPTP